MTDRPKVLLELRGESLLRRHLRIQKAVGIERMVIVVGYEKDQIIAEVDRCSEKPEVMFVESDDYRSKGNSYSLLIGLEQMSGGALVFDGDLFYDQAIFLDKPRPRPYRLLILSASVPNWLRAWRRIHHREYRFH